MKFDLTFKTPDVLDYLDNDEQRNLASKFIKYGEYIKIEFDTDSQTATVIPQKE